ncbi:MAG: hypothetical protein HFE75_14210 [Firmicutes bacterium]|nr:hypothetical protein [Bacillota bacterium]
MDATDWSGVAERARPLNCGQGLSFQRKAAALWTHLSEWRAMRVERMCATKYPIMLIHGIGYEDQPASRYWGRIPQRLEEGGAKVYFGGQDAFGTVAENAARLKVSMERAIADSGADKLNLIAHSKGGIEARYLISVLEMAEKVVSLTTLATPHRGIGSIDLLRKRKAAAYQVLASVFNLMLMVDGRQQNFSLKPYEQLTADYMEVFNQLVPDRKEVYYQSYAFDMRSAASDPALGLFYKVVRKLEGQNDGLVSAASAKWGEFQGVYPQEGKYGISHPRIVDPQHRKRKGDNPDMARFYQEIAARLKALGY